MLSDSRTYSRSRSASGIRIVATTFHPFFAKSFAGSLDQTGMPRRTTPLVRIQKSVPGVACCTSSARRFGAFLPPSAVPENFRDKPQRYRKR